MPEPSIAEYQAFARPRIEAGGYDWEAQQSNYPGWFGRVHSNTYSATLNVEGQVTEPRESIQFRVRAIGPSGVQGYWSDPITVPLPYPESGGS
jgi:hypothetical protein